MTAAARNLLAAFEALPPDDQLELAAEILRRAPAYGELPDAALDAAADELFLGYDAEEAAGAAMGRRESG
jgi:hypothetical protein